MPGAITLGVTDVDELFQVFAVPFEQIAQLWQQISMKDKEIEALKENVERVSEEHKELEERRSKPLSDEEMLRLARDRFGLAFPNEIILVPEE